MTDPIDDILLTAYALGEVDDSALVEQVETALAGDTVARRTVADVRATAAALTDSLKAEADVGLTAIHVAAIERRLAADAQIDAPASLPLHRNWGLWGSVAASMLIVSMVMASVLPKIFLGGNRSTGSAGTGGASTGGDSVGGTLSPGGPVDNNSSERAALPFVATNATASTGGEEINWPILKTSAGGLPWPAVQSPTTGLREPAFVVSSDFPLAVIPPFPSYPDMAGRGTLDAIRIAARAGQVPLPHTIRSDELINAMRYDDVVRTDQPVAARVESAVCPWNSANLLVRISVRTFTQTASPPTNDDSERSPAIVPLVRDLRLSVEVNASAAAGYRVIGYENPPRSWGDWAGRDDFEVLPAGKTFTVLLEVVPAGRPLPGGTKPASGMRYRKLDSVVVTSTELMTVGVEYRRGPSAERAKIEFPLSVEAQAIELASTDFRTAAGVAALGMALRQARPAEDPALQVAEKLLSDVTATDPSEDKQLLLDVARKLLLQAPKKESQIPAANSELPLAGSDED